MHLHATLAAYFKGPPSDENPRQVQLQPLSFTPWMHGSIPLLNKRRADALAFHLARAGEFEDWLAVTVLDPACLTARVAAQGVAVALEHMVTELDMVQRAVVAATHEHRRGRLGLTLSQARRVFDTVRLAAHVLAVEPLELPAQIVARWRRREADDALLMFIDAAVELCQRCTLLPLHPCLPAPGGQCSGFDPTGRWLLRVVKSGTNNTSPELSFAAQFLLPMRNFDVQKLSHSFAP